MHKEQIDLLQTMRLKLEALNYYRKRYHLLSLLTGTEVCDSCDGYGGEWDDKMENFTKCSVCNDKQIIVINKRLAKKLAK